MPEAFVVANIFTAHANGYVTFELPYFGEGVESISVQGVNLVGSENANDVGGCIHKDDDGIGEGRADVFLEENKAPVYDSHQSSDNDYETQRNANKDVEGEQRQYVHMYEHHVVGGTGQVNNKYDAQ